MLGQLTRRHHRPRDTPHEACAADRFLHASTGKNSNTISRDMIGVQRLMLFIAILRVFVLPTIHFTRSASLLLQFILAVFALFVLHYLSLLLSTHVERPKHRERKEFMEMKVRPESLPSPPPACFSHLDILRSQIHLSPFSSSSSCVILRQCHFAHPRPHLFTLSSQFTPESEDSLYASSIAETDSRGGIKRGRKAGFVADAVTPVISGNYCSSPPKLRLNHPYSLSSGVNNHGQVQRENQRRNRVIKRNEGVVKS
ncbi:hypothetical protein EmuJ_000087100 [Echinococcus multilocularis]|uniref:Uncharacterized protein n=1 Tax=Echinococcus multilocularis TaxID=6211 RepID=A0A087VYB4_ECHMU|nr:hypothetical protein EmuJ_000087100 [Echinococcus multilocularis]